MWREYFTITEKRETKIEWYLAQIAWHVYLLRFILGGKPTRTFDSFFWSFYDPENTAKKPLGNEAASTISPEEKREQRRSATRAMKEALKKVFSTMPSPTKKKGDRRKLTLKKARR